MLVIEAGPFDQNQDDLYIPGAWDPFPYIWSATTEPLTALNNRTDTVYCGKIVGGGSTVNAMNYMRYDIYLEPNRACYIVLRQIFVTRGVAADFDGWASLGNPDWGWDGVLPYYIKASRHRNVERGSISNKANSNRVRTLLPLTRSLPRRQTSRGTIQCAGLMEHCSTPTQTTITQLQVSSRNISTLALALRESMDFSHGYVAADTV